MQTVEANGERHLDPAQHRGFDIVEGDLDAGNGVDTHAARLRRSFSTAQRHGSSAARNRDILSWDRAVPGLDEVEDSSSLGNDKDDAE